MAQRQNTKSEETKKISEIDSNTLKSSEWLDQEFKKTTIYMLSTLIGKEQHAKTTNTSRKKNFKEESEENNL